MRLEAADVIRVEIEELPFVTGIYEVDTISMSDDFATARLELTQFDNEIYRFDPATDEQDFTVQDVDVEDVR